MFIRSHKKERGISILDHTKQVADLVKKHKDQELYAKIIDPKDEIFTLKEEDMKLHERVSRFESEAYVNDNLNYEAHFLLDWTRR